MLDGCYEGTQLERPSLRACAAVRARCEDLFHLSRHRDLCWLLMQFLDFNGMGRREEEGAWEADIRKCKSLWDRTSENSQWFFGSYESCCFHQWQHLLGLPAQLITVSDDCICGGCDQ